MCAFIAVAVFTTPLRGQSRPVTEPRVTERQLWRSSDTIYMVFTKRLKEESPFGPQVANQLPDTLRLLLVGDSAVTLNMPMKIYYGRAHTETLKLVAFLRSLVPDTTSKR
jgi:hypothetical protein